MRSANANDAPLLHLRNTTLLAAGRNKRMNSEFTSDEPYLRKGAQARLTSCLFVVAILTCFCHTCFGAQAPSTLTSPNERGFSYRRDVIPDGPWSVNILQIERSSPDLELHTTLAHGSRIGLNVLSEQVKAVPPEVGRPVAAVNGDFYRNDATPYKGDPKGLQIMQGELVSAPCDWSCFWIDAAGNPQMTNVTPKFQVIWPDNTITPIGLNEERTKGTAVLYTFRMGRTTGTTGGREFVLDETGSSAWLPLRAGETYTARVRETREDGNTPINSNRLVLSLSKELLGKVPQVGPGALLRISMATSPSLKGVQTAIGGGPALVQGGKTKKWGLLQVRHPRTAIGWNDKSIYLVEVDGRQPGFSVGMTYSELADYMLNKIGCTEALNLDGGGSATMWVAGQVANSPSKGRERGGANGLVLVQKPEK